MEAFQESVDSTVNRDEPYMSHIYQAITQAEQDFNDYQKSLKEQIATSKFCRNDLELALENVPVPERFFDYVEVKS